ncbi:MAG: hypothetical protein LUC88_02520 [Prevotella sp.]|nr:hypothetical protein [Prevotella sp.]
MRQLSTLQNVILLSGACLMVVGAALYVFGKLSISPFIFSVGALAFAAMQMCQTYLGNDIIIRRLRKIMITSDIFFIIAAILLIENSYHFLFPYFLKWFKNGYSYYIYFIHNNWVVALLIAAVLEIYSTHRISNELNKIKNIK